MSIIGTDRRHTPTPRLGLSNPVPGGSPALPSGTQLNTPSVISLQATSAMLLPLSAAGRARCAPGPTLALQSSQQPWEGGRPSPGDGGPRGAQEAERLQCRNPGQPGHRLQGCPLGHAQDASSPLLSSVLIHLSLAVGGPRRVPRVTACPRNEKGADGFASRSLLVSRQEAPLFLCPRPAAISTAPRGPPGPAVSSIPGIMTTRGCQFSAAMDSSSAVH